MEPYDASVVSFGKSLGCAVEREVCSGVEAHRICCWTSRGLSGSGRFHGGVMEQEERLYRNVGINRERLERGIWVWCYIVCW